MKIKDVIVDELSFSMSFGATDIYKVKVSLTALTFTYRISVDNIYKGETLVFYAESDGSLSYEYRAEVESNPVLESVYNFLFDEREQKILQ